VTGASAGLIWRVSGIYWDLVKLEEAIITHVDSLSPASRLVLSKHAYGKKSTDRLISGVREGRDFLRNVLRSPNEISPSSYISALSYEQNFLWALPVYFSNKIEYLFNSDRFEEVTRGRWTKLISVPGMIDREKHGKSVPHVATAKNTKATANLDIRGGLAAFRHGNVDLEAIKLSFIEYGMQSSNTRYNADLDFYNFGHHLGHDIIKIALTPSFPLILIEVMGKNLGLLPGSVVSVGEVLPPLPPRRRRVADSGPPPLPPRPRG
jgi:hypothetical protein